jgi:hypothetical protein
MKTIAMYVVMTFFSSMATAQNQARETAEFLSDSLYNVPLEGAGSHGSLGFRVGAAGTMVKTPEDNSLFNTVWHPNESRQSAKEVPAQVVIPKYSVLKGFSLPIDAGAWYGKSPSGVSLTGGYLQWTMYEDFAMPAFATRVSYNRMLGLNSSTFDSMAGEAIISYGFIGIFTVYATYGVTRDTLTVDKTEQTFGLIPVDSEDRNYNEVFTSINRGAGVHIQIFPPWLTTAAEMRQGAAGKTYYSAKMAVGF